MVEAQPAEPLSRRERKKERTRREIYDAAMSLFARKGFDQATIAEICEAADVGRGTFFLHFPTKAALLYEFNTRVAESFRSELEEPRRPAREELCALVEQMSAQLQSRSEIMRAMVADFFNSPEALSSAALDGDALPELVTEIIESGQARGEFSRRINARLAAASFFATAATILSGRVFGEHDISADEINRQFLQITLSGLSPDGDPAT
jgi:AcrR family transcriptional regulator